MRSDAKGNLPPRSADNPAYGISEAAPLVPGSTPRIGGEERNGWVQSAFQSPLVRATHGEAEETKGLGAMGALLLGEEISWQARPGR